MFWYLYCMYGCDGNIVLLYIFFSNYYLVLGKVLGCKVFGIFILKNWFIK